MNLRDKTILILGGGGLVGSRTVREVLRNNPKRVITCSLLGERENQYLQEFSKVKNCKIYWGNIFVRKELAHLSPKLLADDPSKRRIFIDDIFSEKPGLFKENYLYKIITDENPDIIIDCINTATVLAYQSVHEKGRQLRDLIPGGTAAEISEAAEALMGSLGMPLLAHHVKVLFKAIQASGRVTQFIKVGTTGTGGMGFDLPFTHGEDAPSISVLTKAAFAGAYSQLLLLMKRTPDFPAVAEIKPAGAIGGDIILRELKGARSDVYIDMGESGNYTRSEFELLTSRGLMNFILADDVVGEIMNIIGGGKQNDVIEALNASLFARHDAEARQVVLDKMDDVMEQYSKKSLVSTSLGPPRVGKMIFEAYLFKKAYQISKARQHHDSQAKLGAEASQLLNDNPELVETVLSHGYSIIKNNAEMIHGLSAGTESVDLRDSNVQHWLAIIGTPDKLLSSSPGHLAGLALASDQSLI